MSFHAGSSPLPVLQLSLSFAILCPYCSLLPHSVNDGIAEGLKTELEPYQPAFCTLYWACTQVSSIMGAMCGVTVSMSGFESRLGLESLGCSMWHFLKLIARGFLWVLWFPPLLHWFNGSANKIKLNSVKLNSWAVPSYQVARNMTLACDKRSMCCTRLHPGHLSVRVGESSRCCEEIVKNRE